MQKRQITLLYSLALLTLGLAIGSSGTLLFLKTQVMRQSPKNQQNKKLPPKPQSTTPVIIEDEPRLGKTNAPITIVEFSDFECPYSALFNKSIRPYLKKQYIDTGLVQFVHKDLPLPFHRQAMPAAAATRCASAQNQYWELYDAIYAQQDCLQCKGVLGIAKEQKLNTKVLEKCMKKDSTRRIVAINTSEARLNNIRATPTCIIGPTRNDGKHTGTIIEGTISWSAFKAAIDQQLSRIR